MRSHSPPSGVSVLFNEPKLLKSIIEQMTRTTFAARFSALQRAEIAEISAHRSRRPAPVCFSALQRAEIAEIEPVGTRRRDRCGFSALQRAEIAEIGVATRCTTARRRVSVLFNEPKLLKWVRS